MLFRFPVFKAIILTALLALAACESAEERAERHFEAGMELLEQGDMARAIVEFRNVFKLDPTHKEARLAYARTQLQRGRRGEAYSSFQRVAEQHPDNVEARIELVTLAVEGRNWDEVERHLAVALELAPDDLRVQTAQMALNYSNARTDDDPIASEKLAEQAQTVLDADPENFTARRIVIDYLLGKDDLDAVLPVIDVGIEQNPEDYELHIAKLRILQRAEKIDEMGDALRKMVEVFPEDEDSHQLLIGWYINQGDNEGAENFLREIANRPDADDASHMSVVQFLRLTKGLDAARAEIDRLIEEKEDPSRFIAVRASMDFDEGEHDKAISALDTLVDGAEEPNEVINDAKVLLARMQNARGNVVGARARIEEVIENDSSHVSALKMRAAWHIEDDKTDDAIIDLRTALSQAPRDPSIMTLMANAHERAGERQLAGERYSLAVELSNQAPEESLRYANYLVGNERPESAEAVLNEALINAPNNVELLQAMVTLQIEKKDWNEVQRIIWKFRSLGTPVAEAAANAVQAEMLLQQNGLEDTIDYLGQLAEEEDGQQAFAALVEAQVRAGKMLDAVAQVEARLKDTPEDPVLRHLRAGLHMMSDERDDAEAIYRSLLDQFPGNDQVLRTLYSLLVATGREDDARQLVDEQVAIVGEDQPVSNALFLKAEILERDRDFEGAIAIYESMYEANSGNIVVANNLASLISAHRDTDESLERAYAVARRLRGIEIPALQDTYGWIEYRRGNYEEALTHLEPAAEGLPNDPLVQYHLARTYLALDRKDEALEAFERAIEIAGENPLPQLVDARSVVEDLKSQAAE